jgi:hypothetical protein
MTILKKYCKDCKNFLSDNSFWYSLMSIIYSEYRCKINKGKDFISGEDEIQIRNCRELNSNGECRFYKSIQNKDPYKFENGTSFKE